MAQLLHQVAGETPHSPWQTGAEPLPGYRLLEPVGRGACTEVWKCAVGGLTRAIKFVHGLSGLAPPEVRALQHLTTIRHPFLLSLERVEISGHELMIVMELADQHLQALFDEYRAAGRPGIPREELLGYLIEAAEALDLLNHQHGLHHLDVKPTNLFLAGNHVKLADFGLGRAAVDPAPYGARLAMSRYAAPEIGAGAISPHSDQYSLAVVYQELLTGTVPFSDQNAPAANPNLEPLPAPDRPLVARALAPLPRARFASCLEFVQALLEVPGGLDPAAACQPKSSSLLRRPTVFKKTGLIALPARRAASDTDAGRPELRETATNLVLPSPSSCAALPGFRFVDGLLQSPLGELWRVETEEGSPRLAHLLPGFLVGFPEIESRLLDTLETLQHPALPAVEVFRSPAGRLVLVTESFTQTLRDRFAECQGQGQRGIPRDELLEYLGQAAQALDELATVANLWHLGLSPRHLILRQGRIELREFALVQLVWLASKQSPGQLALRYAAPELLDKGPAPASDQYSLALIYAELLSGVQQRQSRAGARTSAVRRRIDLDLLPAADREALARALDAEPGKRFATCTDFLQALRPAGRRADERKSRDLPGIISLGTPPQGAAAPEDPRLPSPGQLVTDAMRAGGSETRTHGHCRYLVHRKEVLEHRCGLAASPGSLLFQLQGFARTWNLQGARQEGHSWLARLPVAGSFWKRWLGKPAGLEIAVHWSPRRDSSLSALLVRVGTFGPADQLPFEQLQELGPRIVESLRLALQVKPEDSGDLVCPLAQPLAVFPVLAQGDLGQAIEGTSITLCEQSIEFRLPTTPGADQVYVNFPALAAVAQFALLTRITKSATCPDGGLLVEGTFPEPESPFADGGKSVC